MTAKAIGEENSGLLPGCAAGIAPMTITLRDRAFRRTAVRLVTRCKRLSKLRVLIWITLLVPDDHALFFWLISARPPLMQG